MQIHDLKIINKERDGDLLWQCTLGKETVGVWALKKTTAEQKAVEHFKPSKKERKFITVVPN